MNTIEQKMKIDELPASASSLYVALYRKRKVDKTITHPSARNKHIRKIIKDAKLSWKSLSPSKKKYFYETIYCRNVLNYAHTLSKTETYLKEKNPRSDDHRSDGPSTKEQGKETEKDAVAVCVNEKEISLDVLMEGQDELSTILINTELEMSLESQRCAANTQKKCTHSVNNLRESISSSINSKTESDDILDTQSNPDSNQEISTAKTPLCEPTPPCVKTGQDLYNLIKGPDAKDWKDISLKEKRHCHGAVRTLKREYIKNYTQYLESLSKQELYDHYVKTLH